MTLNDLINRLEQMNQNHTSIGWETLQFVAPLLRQQAQEIKDLKNANRFIQNFAEEQHRRAVALEMRELSDEEIEEVAKPYCDLQNWVVDKHDFARAILKKAGEK